MLVAKGIIIISFNFFRRKLKFQESELAAKTAVTSGSVRSWSDNEVLRARVPSKKTESQGSEGETTLVSCFTA